MVLSVCAFYTAHMVYAGALTVHDLRWSLGFRDLPDQHAEKTMREALAELCRFGLLKWNYEPQYGDIPGVEPESLDETCFLRYWNLCFDETGPHGKIPDAANPTLFLEATEDMRHEITKPEYDSAEFTMSPEEWTLSQLWNPA